MAAGTAAGIALLFTCSAFCTPGVSAFWVQAIVCVSYVGAVARGLWKAHEPLARRRHLETASPSPLGHQVEGGMAADRESAPLARQAPQPNRRALLLGSNPSIRAHLASALQATGRAVIACADWESVRAFLEATPDRIELLVLDDWERFETEDALRTKFRALAPHLKIIVLTRHRAISHSEWPWIHQIQKPFDVHELRATLTAILAAP